MINSFDEAREASEEILENGQTGGQAEDVLPEDVAEQTGEEAHGDGGTDGTGASTDEENARASLDEAASTAETTAQAASDMNAQLQQALQDIEALREQNQQLQGTIDELSQRNEENLIEEALTPPVLNLNELAFADEDVQKEAMAKYAEEMSEYNRRQFMKEMKPAIEYAREGMRQAEKAEAIEALKQIPQLAGIDKMLPQLDRIIANSKWLSSADMPTDEKYINAFALANGINSINNPPEQSKKLSADELMEIYNSDPTFRDMVEKQRIDEIRQGQQVPAFSASSGAASAALNIQDKPRSFDEALENAKKQHIF